MADELPQELLKTLSEPRRAFVRKFILGAAFVIPSVMTFPMSGLGLGEAIAQTGNHADFELFQLDERALESDERALASDERKLEPSPPPPELHELGSEQPPPQPHELRPLPYQALPPEINSAQMYRAPK